MYGYYYHASDGRKLEEIFNDKNELIGFKCPYCNKTVKIW